MDDGLDARTTKIFLANKDYLQLIQPELREAIEKRVEGTSIFATYELLIKLGEQIKATQFFAAVGFSFSSGLRLVKPLMDQVRSNNGKIELVVGALQTYGSSRKNTLL